jgi:hypothetical protein
MKVSSFFIPLDRGGIFLGDLSPRKIGGGLLKQNIPQEFVTLR